MKKRAQIENEFNLHLKAHQHQAKARVDLNNWGDWQEDNYKQTLHELNMLRWVLDYRGEGIIKKYSDE